MGNLLEGHQSYCLRDEPPTSDGIRLSSNDVVGDSLEISHQSEVHLTPGIEIESTLDGSTSCTPGHLGIHDDVVVGIVCTGFLPCEVGDDEDLGTVWDVGPQGVSDLLRKQREGVRLVSPPGVRGNGHCDPGGVGHLLDALVDLPGPLAPIAWGTEAALSGAAIANDFVGSDGGLLEAGALALCLIE